MYDSVYMPFEQYLEKYYNVLNPKQKTKWDRWYIRYIEPAFEESRHAEMIKNFGYVSIDKHNFKVQSDIYQQLEQENRMDDETKKFIGFLAGAGFFEQWKLTLKDWMNNNNWYNPYLNTQNQKTINEILNYQNGLNYLKTQLPEMPFWKR